MIGWLLSHGPARKAPGLILTAAAILLFLLNLVFSRWALRPVQQAWAQQQQFIAEYLAGETILSHQAIQTYRHTLRQTRPILPVVRSFGLHHRLVGLIENRP